MQRRPLRSKRNDDMVYVYIISQVNPQDGLKYGHEIAYCSNEPLKLGSLLKHNGILFRVKKEGVRFKR